MVGLSVVLEAQKDSVSEKTCQVINKTMMLNTINKHCSSYAASLNLQHTSLQGSTFLELCFLCRRRLLPEKDIYMYKGDRAFCSVECRCKQILMDEEESIEKEKCFMAAMRPKASSSSSSSEALHREKGARNRPGGFAY